MAQKFKNKVTLFFDKERKQNLRVFLHTLEQTNVFIQFIRRCTTLPYIAYIQESYKNGTWKQVNEQELEITSEYAAARAEVAPYRLELCLNSSNKCAPFKFDTYYFSSLDIDFFINLIVDGTRSADVAFFPYVRDRTTHEWTSYSWNRGIPHEIAGTYLSLSSENKTKADKYIQMLTRV